jgi:formamidopyrimidine-DNA glycosylase
MDQRKIAGIGNIYADEILFRAGIRPTRRAKSLTGEETKEMRRAMREVLREAIACGGSSVSDYVLPTGKLGYFQERHRVYGREGRKCVRCGEKIKRMALGGRGTHWCRKCQR